MAKPIHISGRRPSILELFETTGTIESLAAMRLEMLCAVASGEIAPSLKTFEAWRDMIWMRVFEFMARDPRGAPYVFNLVLTWEKPAQLHTALENYLHTLTAPLPSDAEIETARWIAATP